MEIDKLYKFSNGFVQVNGVVANDEEQRSEKKYFATDGSIQELKNGDLLTPITYKELVELRDNGELVPGMRYRITDYVSEFTTFGSARHLFDVIVLATTPSELNENALATRSVKDAAIATEDYIYIISNSNYVKPSGPN